jgi:Ala-tRNA(Pro) deacylase
MIPAIIEAHLRERYSAYEHHVHAAAATAQELAAAEHVSGYRVAKLVVLRLGGRLVIAVVAATDRVNVQPLEEATGARAELVPEAEFSDRFSPCEPGAEPPLAIFGVPIYVDDKLIRERAIVIPAGTHEDAAIVDTSEWSWSERALNLGRRAVHGCSATHCGCNETRQRSRPAHATVPPIARWLHPDATYSI